MYIHRKYEKIWVIAQIQFKSNLHGQEDLRSDLGTQTKNLFQRMTLSSSGLGQQAFTLSTWFRIPLESPKNYPEMV